MTKGRLLYSKAEKKPFLTATLPSDPQMREITHISDIDHFYEQKDNWIFHLEICAGYLLLELPFPVVQRTYLASFEPARDAVEVESVLEEKVQITSFQNT